MKKIIDIFLNCWEIIQNTIGYIEYKKHKLQVNHQFKHSNIVYINYFDSHVLGKWIFINPKTDDNIILRHEYGHRIQSYLLGPLYLLIIYLPSLLHYKWFSRKNKDWNEYYDFFTERNANKLSKKKENSFSLQLFLIEALFYISIVLLAIVMLPFVICLGICGLLCRLLKYIRKLICFKK
jgi:hypothetical protein